MIISLILQHIQSKLEAESKKLLVIELDARIRLSRLSTPFVHKGFLDLVLRVIVDTAIVIFGADSGIIQIPRS